MIQQISKEDIEFCECLYNTVCMAEALFTSYDNLSQFESGKLGHIRLGQIPLLSHEYLIAEDPNLSDKENFTLLMKSANSYIMGGRNFGKSITEKIDMLISLILHDGWPMALTSYDAVHIRGIMEPIVDCLESHQILKEFKKSIKRSPTYLIISKTDAVLESINMNINSSNSGSQFFQKHLKKIWLEEASFETEEVYRSRVDSRHEQGCIERASGMTNFTKHSPIGKIFYDLSMKPAVLNLPQYINPNWGSEEKKKSIKKFGGEDSIGYRMFIRGEVVEEGISVFDMARIRPFYVEDRVLKSFEITKEKFTYFHNIIVAERPNNASAIYISADIGESAPTEILIFAQVNERFKLLYNITLYGLMDKEQFLIFKYLAEQVQANFIALDTTDGTGRAIFRRLEEVFPKENLVWVCFSEKIAVDFAKDENSNYIYKNGEPTYIEEFVSEWSVLHLKDILYAGLIEIPAESYKLDIQLNSVKAFHSGTRVTYEVFAEEDHTFQSLQVFSIAQWMNQFNLINPVTIKEFAKGFV